MIDTAEPAVKIIRPLLPYNASPGLIATLPFTPPVTALTFFNKSDTELVMPPPNPIVPITPLTYKAPPVVEPAMYAKYRSHPLTPDYDLYVK